MKTESAALAVVTVVTFGAVVPGSYPTADDGMITGLLHELNRRTPSLAAKLWGVISRASIGGHFRPVQDLSMVTSYQLLGPQAWTRGVSALYLGFHVGSAILLCAILERLGCARYLALLAAAVFALHPVCDESLSSILFGANVPGLFFLLAGCWVWASISEPEPRLFRGRLAAGAALLFLSMGCNPNFILTAPAVMGYMAVRRGFRPERLKAVLGAGLTIAVATALTLAHRLVAYGALTTRQGVYDEIRPSLDVLEFGRELVSTVVRLVPSSSARLSVGLRNPSRMPPVHFDVPFVSWELLLLVALVVALVGLALVLGWKGVPPGPGTQTRRCQSLLFGGVLAIACLAPYFAFLGRIGLNRYAYPAVAGLSVLVVVAADLLAHRLCSPRFRHHGPAVVSLALAPVFVIFLRTDREAVQSIVRAQQTARLLVHEVARDLSDQLAVKRIYVLGYPRVLGRSGYTYPYQWALRRMVSVTLGRKMLEDERSLLDDRETGRLALPLPAWAAVFWFRAQDSRVIRIRDPSLLTLDGPLVSVLWDDHFSYLNAFPHRLEEEMASSDPRIVERLADCLGTRLPDRGPNIIRRALQGVNAEEPAGRPLTRSFAALAVPAVRARLVRGLGPCTAESTSLAEAALPGGTGRAVLTEAVSTFARTCPRNLGLKLAVAMGVDDGLESGLHLAALVDPSVERETLEEAIREEREGRRLTISGAVRGRPVSHFQAADRLYHRLGISRPEVDLALLRSQLDSAAAEGPVTDSVSRWIRRGVPLDGEARSLVALKEGVQPGPIRLERVVPRKPAATGSSPGATVLFVIRNFGSLPLPGGVSPYATRLRWRWYGEGSDRPSSWGARLLPDAGVSAHRMLRVPCFIPAPRAEAPLELAVDLMAWGHVVARLPRARLPEEDPDGLARRFDPSSPGAVGTSRGPAR